MNSDESFFSEENDEYSEPVGAITSNSTKGKNIFTTIQTEVFTPSEYLDDYFITIRSSALIKARSVLLEGQNSKSNRKFDIFLGLASLFLGVFISYFFSPGDILNEPTTNTIAGLLISFFLAIIFAILAYFTEKIENTSKKDMAERVLELLVDPEKVENGDIT